jgi:hypothetical protein
VGFVDATVSLQREKRFADFYALVYGLLGQLEG